MFVGYGGYNPQVYGGAYAYAGPGGAGAGAFAGYQAQSGLSGALLGGGGGWGGYAGGGYGGGFGGFAGVGSMAGYYLGTEVTHTQTPIYQDFLNRQAWYKTCTETQANTVNTPGKMWDVWFDHKDGQKTQQRSPIVLDLNNNGKADITGANITGDGKVDGPTTKFDIDPSRDTYQYKSLRRRPGKGAPKVKGGKWVENNGVKQYVDKDGNVQGELRPTGKKGKMEYHYGKVEKKEETEWLAKNGGDGFLVWDVDKDGQITSSKELFGEFDVDGKKKFANGYEKLAYYFDKNKDGKVAGAELEGLQIWKDTNADGKVDAGEMEQLGKYSIQSFDVSNYNKQTMEGSFNKQTTTYTDVQKTVLAGYKDEWVRRLVGYQDNYQVNQYGGAFAGTYAYGGGYGYGGGWGGGWW